MAVIRNMKLSTCGDEFFDEEKSVDSETQMKKHNSRT